MKPDTDSDFDFTEFIAEHDHGATNQLMGERMQRVVLACLNHKGSGKSKGKVNLTLEIVANDGRAQVTATITSTDPQPGSLTSTYFTTETGGLADENPRQTAMPARILKPTPIRGGDGGGS